LKGLNGNEAAIEGISHVKSLKEETTLLNNMQSNVDVAGENKTNLVVDRATGWIVKGESHSTMSGAIHINENSQLPDGMTIPISVTIRMVYSPVE